jgi:hypothetical protein
MLITYRQSWTSQNIWSNALYFGMVGMVIHVSCYLIGVCTFETTLLPQADIHTCNTQIICLQYLKTYKLIIIVINNDMFLIQPQFPKFLWPVWCSEQTAHLMTTAMQHTMEYCRPSRYTTHKCRTNIWNCSETGSLILMSIWGKNIASCEDMELHTWTIHDGGIMPVYKLKLFKCLWFQQFYSQSSLYSSWDF